ncbi:hypothetical protein QVD17_29237 [Tagetes erecta]|uniref:Uncharacterized protein n=1 Tax=Tagetes erecta TaxID=13708 RepID=A0AAD8NSY3_TARER|nr:hypothetical protein QVD17_29237 [Tagetes erecta]
MQSSSSSSSFFHPLKPARVPFSGTHRHRLSFPNHRYQLATMAFKKDGFSGKMVDEDMITLRERIRKMKFESDDHRLTDDWMHWEKMYYCSGGYHSDVYEVVAFLQNFLVESRPSVAVGLVAGLVIGGSTTAVMVLHLLMKLVMGD